MQIKKTVKQSLEHQRFGRGGGYYTFLMAGLLLSSAFSYLFGWLSSLKASISTTIGNWSMLSAFFFYCKAALSIYPNYDSLLNLS